MKKNGDIMTKFITCDQAVEYIKDNDTLGISGSGGSGSAEGLLKALNQRFTNQNHPRNLTITSGIVPGDLSSDLIGINNLAAKGLVGKAICSQVGKGKLFETAVMNNQFPTFCIPLGVYGHLLRAIAGHKPGVLTHVGLNTFADPRIEGCRANLKAQETENIVELLDINGTNQLLYKAFPINVAFIKASLADELGNISLKWEPIIGEQYELAIATHNSGGIVIVEVENIVPAHTIPAKEVLIHNKLVDYVVVHKQELRKDEYNFPNHRPELIGLTRIIPQSNELSPLTNRKICGRRSALELRKDYLVNLGIGMPDQVAVVAKEEGIYEDLCLSIEMGPMGGIPIGGNAFGASINPDAIISTASTFDMYDGGILDLTVVGLAEVDEQGNVNVSKFGPKVTGPGGFINITQNTPKVIFQGTMTAGGLVEEIKDGKLVIVKEGTQRKFINKVQQITFSSNYAKEHNQEILYVTERAVFQLLPEGLTLIEIAPGIDLQKDVLDQMDFTPVISPNLKLMDERIFQNQLMNLKENF